MPRKGWSDKPCPGCGEPGFETSKGICGGCITLLGEARRARAAALVNPEEIVYATPSYIYGYYHRGSGHYETHSQHYKDLLRKLMEQLFKVLGKEAPANTKGYYNRNPATGEPFPMLFDNPYRDGARASKERAEDTTSRTRERLIFRPEVADVIRELDQAIRRLVEASYEDGYIDGQSLLMQLAAGSISIEDFNKKSTGNKGV
jgi:hypothetical protein